MSFGVRPAPSTPTVKALLIPELGDIKELSIPVPGRMKTRDWLVAHIGPLFDEDYEHVAVLYQGNRRDMFVGETSSINGRHIRNIRATEIYRSATISRDPWRDRETLPAISGPAVIFPDATVWR